MLLSFTNTYVEVLTRGKTPGGMEQGVSPIKGETAVAPRRDSRGSFSGAIGGKGMADCLEHASPDTRTESFWEISAANTTDEGGSEGGGDFVERQTAPEYAHKRPSNVCVEIFVLVACCQTPPRIALSKLKGDFAKKSGVHIHAPCQAQPVPLLMLV